MKTNILVSPAPAVPTQTFQAFLREELARRCARNAQYSVRAFAKFLRIDHSTLSQILRGKRALTVSMVDRLGSRLGLDHDQCARFAADSTAGWPDPETRDKMTSLVRDAEFLISEWQHYAILELIHLDSFKPDSRWIARVLGISVDEVNTALQRLLRLGLLKMISAEKWEDRAAGGISVGTPDGRTDFRFRHHSTSTMAIPSSRLAFVLEMLGRLRREIAEELAGDEPRQQVYRLDIHFYPLTVEESE